MAEETNRPELASDALTVIYRQSVENSPNPIFSIDRDGRILTWNRSCERLFQYGDGVRGQRAITLLCLPQDHARIGVLAGKVFEGDSFGNVDIGFKSRDGSVSYMVSRLYPVFDNNGRVVACVFANTDVTERKLLEEALKTEREIFKVLSDFDEEISGLQQRQVTGHALTFLKTRLRIARASIALLGHGGRDFIVTDVTDTSAGMEKGAFISLEHTALSSVVKTGKPLYRRDIAGIPHKNEHDKMLLGKGILSSFLTPLIAGGECIGTLNIGSPVTDGITEGTRRIIVLLAPRLCQALTNARLFETLQESETRYRDLFEKANDAIFIVDSEMRYVDANRKATELFGYSREEFVAMSILDVVPPEQAPRSSEQFEKLFESGTYDKFMGKVKTKDGRWLDVEVSASAIVRDGEVVGSRDVVRDITEQKKKEEEDIKSQKLESIGLLAGGLAHDFNNLLTAILGNISLAKMYLSENDNIYAHLTEAEKASVRASGITRQLLTFSKGGHPVKQTLSIGDLVREAAGFAVRGSSVKCRFVIPSCLRAVEADEGQMSQVVHNLVINAVQAMPNGGVITITCRNTELDSGELSALKAGEYVRISIQDSGIGIPPENLRKIFDPYFTTKQKGSGLGLATAYSIVRRHGGHMTVESLPGSGTTFHVLLPASPQFSGESTAEDPGLICGRGRILVIDDEEAVRQVAESLLTELGYEVESAGDGSRALAIYGQAMKAGNPFCAVIMDLTIPGGMGGRETMRKLLEIDPDARVVVSSGYSNDLITADYGFYGFCGVLTKPYTPEELSEKVFRAINIPPTKFS